MNGRYQSSAEFDDERMSVPCTTFKWQLKGQKALCTAQNSTYQDLKMFIEEFILEGEYFL